MSTTCLRSTRVVDNKAVEAFHTPRPSTDYHNISRTVSRKPTKQIYKIQGQMHRNIKINIKVYNVNRTNNFVTKLAKSSFYKNATNGPKQAMRGNRCMEESTCHGMVIDQVVFIIVIYDLLVTYRECLFIFLHFFISFIHDFYVDAESMIDLVEREKCQ